MKETKFLNPFTLNIEKEIRIERDDIEQALSWFDRLPITKTNSHDQKVYQDLKNLVVYMRSLDIN